MLCRAYLLFIFYIFSFLILITFFASHVVSIIKAYLFQINILKLKILILATLIKSYLKSVHTICTVIIFKYEYFSKRDKKLSLC